jgi:TFIIH p62 subunit, N-terminal domain
MTPSKGATSIRGSAAYKKRDGTLSISKDQTSIIWVPIHTRDASSVTINVADVTSTSQEGESLAITMLIQLRFTTNPRVRSKGDAEDLREVT